MKSYVISLQSADDRRNHIKKEFGHHHISFEFFDAITPELAKSIISSDYPNLDISQISIGEIACVVSHLAVWKQVLNQEDDYVAIFEDDVFLGDDTSNFLNDANWLNADLKLIKIETFYENIILKPTTYQKFGRQIYELKTPHFGAAGYIISKQAIFDIINYIKQQIILKPLDHILFSDILSEKLFVIHQITPALCIQEKILKQDLLLESSLDEYRNVFKPQKKIRSVSAKIIRELLRIYHKLRLALFARKVPFL